MFDQNNNLINLKGSRQFASDTGDYKAGDNITLGFNFTYNASQKYNRGTYHLYLGD